MHQLYDATLRHIIDATAHFGTMNRNFSIKSYKSWTFLAEFCNIQYVFGVARRSTTYIYLYFTKILELLE